MATTTNSSASNSYAAFQATLRLPNETILACCDADFYGYHFGGVAIDYLDDETLEFISLVARIRGMNMDKIPAYWHWRGRLYRRQANSEKA